MSKINGFANGINGVKHSRPLAPGIWAPVPTFFLQDSEELGEHAVLCSFVEEGDVVLWPQTTKMSPLPPLAIGV